MRKTLIEQILESYKQFKENQARCHHINEWLKYDEKLKVFIHYSGHKKRHCEKLYLYNYYQQRKTLNIINLLVKRQVGYMARLIINK